MSNQIDPLPDSLNTQTIQAIERLDLPMMQKHHVRILAHCLNVLQTNDVDNSSLNSLKNSLKTWCDNQSKKFDDEEFSDLLYEQLLSTAKKLNAFSENIDKKVQDLDVYDLVLLVKQS